MFQTKASTNLRKIIDSFLISGLQFAITDHDKSTIFCPNFAN